MILPLLLMLAAPIAPAGPLPDHIDKVMSRYNGKTQATAYRVKSIADEREILRRLGLRQNVQSLVTKGRKTYDVEHAINPTNDEAVVLWFDVSLFVHAFDM